MPSNMVYLCSWLLQSIWLFPSLSASVGHACFIMVIAGLQLWVVFLMQILFCYRYPKATEIFEGIARQSINNNLLKYGVRGILLNAGICQLCRGDPVAITNSLERYQVCIGSVLILISKCVPLSSFIKMFCYNFSGNWPNFLWDTGIQAFSCMNTYLPFFFFLILVDCMPDSYVTLLLVLIIKYNFRLLLLSWSSNCKVFSKELTQ